MAYIIQRQKNLPASFTSNFKNFLKKKKPGFALVEVSIALTILGIIGAMSLPLILRSMQHHKAQTSKMHAEQIFYALSAFVLQEGRLPCPTSPAAPSASFGEEMESCLQNAEGIVPFKTLGIPESLSKDGFGRYFTYVVEPTLTSKELSKEKSTISPLSVNILQDRSILKSSSSKISNFCKAPSPALALQVINSKKGIQTPVLPQGKDFIAIILVSHGEQGHGAFEANQTLVRRKASIHGPDEEHNINEDKIFLQKNFSSHPDTYFDDLIFWVSRSTLLPLYAHKTCD